MQTAEAPRETAFHHNRRVGIGLWLASGVIAFLIARLVPLARRKPWGELAASLLLALVLGILATALDFGGWNEPDWRAGLFAFFGSFAAIGAARAVQSAAKT